MDNEPYPGYDAERRQTERRDALRVAARAEPLPGPLLDAFAGVPEEIAGFRLRPVVHYDFVLLRLLDSPILKHLAGNAERESGPTPLTDDDSYVLIYQLSQPIQVWVDWWEKHPDRPRAAAAFRRLARAEIGLKHGPLEVALLIRAAEREIVRAFSTVVKYAPKETSGDFLSPPAPKETASAGGSITSAD